MYMSIVSSFAAFLLVSLIIFINNFNMQESYIERQTSKDISPNKEKQNVDNIQSTKAALDETIQQLNSKLHQHFQNKEQALLEQYKQELIDAQKELNQLKSTTNQEEIKNKMLQRKKELQRERHQLIQTNIFFSSKCQEYKRKLADLVAEGKELERELVFLDAQIQSTTKRKYQVLTNYDQEATHTAPAPTQPHTASKSEAPNSLPLLSDRKPAPSTRKLVNSVSVKSTNKRNLIEEGLQSRMKRSLVRGQVPKGVLEKTPLEEMFETTVEEVKARRKGKKVQNPRGEQFSDYEKKLIMEEFLSREEVKKKIYEIIFEADEKKPSAYSMQPQTKIKISYDDIS